MPLFLKALDPDIDVFGNRQSFHFNNEDIKKFVLEDINSELLEINKKTGIFYKNKYISFPFQNNIDELDKGEFIECLYDTYFKEEKNTFHIYGCLWCRCYNKTWQRCKCTFA